MRRAKRFCRHAGCGTLTDHVSGYCEEHRAEWDEMNARRDRRRGTAYERGYDRRWNAYSRWYLRQPGHQLCVLHLDTGCAVIAQCVDHIVPPAGRNDPLFWDSTNHQPACIHCNSVKNDRVIRGKGSALE